MADKKSTIDLVSNIHLKSKYNSFNKTSVLVIKTLSKDLQEFVNQQIKNGTLLQYQTAGGLAVSKLELERLLLIAENSLSLDTLLNPNDDIDVSDNYFYKSAKELRENGVNTKDFIQHKSNISKNKYIDLRLILKPYVNKIAKILGCNPPEILKQLEPIFKKQFLKSKKKEMTINE